MSALGSVVEISCELIQLGCRRGVSVRGGGLGRRLQVRRYLGRNLLVLGGVRFLKLLQRAKQLRERRKLAVVRLGGGSAHTVGSSARWRAGALQGSVKNLLEIAVQAVDGAGTHGRLIGMLKAVLQRITPIPPNQRPGLKPRTNSPPSSG